MIFVKNSPGTITSLTAISWGDSLNKQDKSADEMRLALMERNCV